MLWINKNNHYKKVIEEKIESNVFNKLSTFNFKYNNQFVEVIPNDSRFKSLIFFQRESFTISLNTNLVAIKRNDKTFRLYFSHHEEAKKAYDDLFSYKFSNIIPPPPYFETLTTKVRITNYNSDSSFNLYKFPVLIAVDKKFYFEAQNREQMNHYLSLYLSKVITIADNEYDSKYKALGNSGVINKDGTPIIDFDTLTPTQQELTMTASGENKTEVTINYYVYNEEEIPKKIEVLPLRFSFVTNSDFFSLKLNVTDKDVFLTNVSKGVLKYDKVNGFSNRENNVFHKNRKINIFFNSDKCYELKIQSISEIKFLTWGSTQLPSFTHVLLDCPVKQLNNLISNSKNNLASLKAENVNEAILNNNFHEFPLTYLKLKDSTLNNFPTSLITLILNNSNITSFNLNAPFLERVDLLNCPNLSSINISNINKLKTLIIDSCPITIINGDIQLNVLTLKNTKINDWLLNPIIIAKVINIDLSNNEFLTPEKILEFLNHFISYNNNYNGIINLFQQETTYENVEIISEIKYKLNVLKSKYWLTHI